MLRARSAPPAVTDIDDSNSSASASGERPRPVSQSFKVAAVASLAGLRDSCGDVPLDAFVAVRTGTTSVKPLRPETQLVLQHVDGKLTLGEIATQTRLPLYTAIEAYLDLVSLGIVGVAVTPEPPVALEVTQLDDTDEPVDEHASTGVSDVVGQFARLSIATTSVPTLRGAIDWSELTDREAWAVSVVSAGMSVQAILQVSPLSEEETLTLLGHLIASRTIAVRS
jgi:hypothetical protein